MKLWSGTLKTQSDVLGVQSTAGTGNSVRGCLTQNTIAELVGGHSGQQIQKESGAVPLSCSASIEKLSGVCRWKVGSCHFLPPVVCLQRRYPKTATALAGESMNQYIGNAIDMRMAGAGESEDLASVWTPAALCAAQAGAKLAGRKYPPLWKGQLLNKPSGTKPPERWKIDFKTRTAGLPSIGRSGDCYLCLSCGKLAATSGLPMIDARKERGRHAAL